jgi:hypothetical protein
MSSHTKNQLIALAPEEMLFQHMQKLNLPEYVITEMWEQKNFISQSSKEKMNHWTYNQFISWYERGQ